jgi:hypothetical protein
MSKGLQLALEEMRRERNEAARRVEDLDRGLAELERVAAGLDPNLVVSPAVERKEFTDMTLRDAAKLVLQRANGPMPTRALCNALLEGGFKTVAREFYMVVYAGLKCMEHFARTDKGAWVYLEGAAPGSYVDDKVNTKARKALAKGAAAER